jgi:hypothetical protein
VLPKVETPSYQTLDNITSKCSSILLEMVIKNDRGDKVGSSARNKIKVKLYTCYEELGNKDGILVIKNCPCLSVNHEILT